MKSILETAYTLEDENDFEGAFLLYRNAFDMDRQDFQLWRSFYFFLWYCLVEDGFLKCEKFILDYNLRKEYDLLLNYGHETYSDIPEFNFIVGYTISVYPYLFPNILESEYFGNQLIKKAWNLERSNLIYNMVRLGDTLPGSKEYSKSCINASTLVLNQYEGKGYLNAYFRSVLFRI
jgi:hypothetical protein